jgi:tRNA nucleotidyltransferase/poly(A) polymerase
LDRKKSGIAASLARLRPVAALARLARAQGLGAWIVGGALRDALLGIASPDVDVAVSRDSEGLVRGLEAEGLGRAVVLSESPRVVRLAGRTTLDVADLERGSIARDLERRDFTANALAIDLATGDWLDPFGGAADISRRRLRLILEENLVEDPLRVLRAARFYATHGLRPDRRLREACRRNAPALAGVASERIAGELSRLLEAPLAAPAFGWAERIGLLPPALGLAPDRARSRRSAALIRRLDPLLQRRPGPTRRAVRLAAVAAALRMTPAEAAAWIARRRFGRAEARMVAGILDLAARAAGGASGRAGWAWVHDAGPLAGPPPSRRANRREAPAALPRARTRAGRDRPGRHAVDWTRAGPAHRRAPPGARDRGAARTDPYPLGGPALAER